MSIFLRFILVFPLIFLPVLRIIKSREIPTFVFLKGGANMVRMVNSAVYAMQVLQQEMTGEAERTGLTSEEDVMALVKELRSEDEKA